MVKIDLITGFLGSGKTTFIKEYATYLMKMGQRICILENDYGAINVDTMLLGDVTDAGAGIESIAGGCDADCHKRRYKTKLIAMAMSGYDRVIVEPSGIYDVDEFFDTLYEDPIDRMYETGNVIAIVDAAMLLENRRLSDLSYYVLSSQVACAKKIILSHVKDLPKDGVSRVAEILNAHLKEIKSARIIDENDIICHEDFKLSDDEFEVVLGSGYHPADYRKKSLGDDADYDAKYFMDLKLDLNTAKKLISDVFDGEAAGRVYRVKGFVFDEGKWYEINATKKDTDIRPVTHGQDVLIMIGEGVRDFKISGE